MQVQAQQTIADSVLKNTHLLIEALKDNYRQYAIRGHQRSIVIHGTQVEYHQQRIDELKSGDCSINYIIESGRKYHKLILIDGGGGRSVHAFVDKKTGEIYKPASWKSPAKGVRYDLRIIEQRERVLATCDWAGGYLYA